MALDDFKFGELKNLLGMFVANQKFHERVLSLRNKPFFNPDQQTDISLEEAREEGTQWPWTVLAGLAIFILLYLIGAYLGHFFQQGFEIVQRLGLHTPSLHPLSWWQWLIVFLAVMGGSIYLGPILFKAPANAPDPLFGRILQTGLKEPKPLSAQVILHLLQNRRFAPVLERACDLTLPESESSTRWDPFVQRLADALRDDERVLELLQGRPSGPPPEDGKTPPIDEAISRHLIYTTRKMLFEAVVSDPDLRYIYDGMAQWHRGLIKWIAAIDFAKAKDLFGKRGEKGMAHGADIQGIANVALVVLVIMSLEGAVTRGPSEPGKVDNKVDSQELARLNDDLKDLRDAILKGLVEFGKARPEQPVCPAPAAINITPPKSDPAIINVPAPIINVPSKLSVEVTSTSTSSIEKNTPPPKPDPSRERTTGGDTFLTLGPDAPKDASTKLMVDEGKGIACSYQAALVTQSPWPPDPVEVKVSDPDPQNAAACPKLDLKQPERNVVPAGSKALYNGLLSAYVSVEEMHRKWLGVGKEFVVLRIHAQSAP